MFQVGDLVLYESTGVCRVTDIKEQEPDGKGEKQLFYVLSPLYHNYTILTPVHSTKVFMRPIISRDEAERLIDRIPDIRAEAYHNPASNQLAEHYKASLSTHDCADLLKLSISIYVKKQFAEQQKRKLGAVDEKYMHRAEDLLFGELAAALNIRKDEVPEYIEERVSRKQKHSGR